VNRSDYRTVPATGIQMSTEALDAEESSEEIEKCGQKMLTVVCARRKEANS
jgi:hypothetical protein